MSIWQECTDCLRTELTVQEFNTWIRPLTVESGPSDLRLYAPNRYIAEWVRDKFQGRIEEIVQQHCDEPPQVILLVGIGGSEAFDGAPPPLPAARRHNGNGAAPGNGAPPRANQVPRAGRAPATNRTSRTNRSPRTNGANGANGWPLTNGANDAAPSAFNSAPAPRRRLRHQGALNAEYTFENFVEGKSNEMALGSAHKVAANPGGTNNPLCIYGGVGLGKTHLMHAIGNRIKASRPDTNVVYLDSERFVSTMINALHHQAMPEFKEFYRSADTLLIDDIQFFVGKNRSQDEFFHTYNALLGEGRQIIVTSDKYPKDIRGLSERLRSRLGRGLTVEVDPPELETRAAILLKKAALCNVALPSDAAMYIAQHLRANVRELEGALKKVIAHAEIIKGGPITTDLVKEALRDLFAVQEKLVTIDNIQRTVAEYYKIKMADMLSKRRTRSIVRPRQMAMSLARQLTNRSLPEIGDAFGGRDHTTVMHACDTINKLRQSTMDFQEDHKNLLRLLST